MVMKDILQLFFRLIFLIRCVVFSNQLFAQKRPLDHSSVANWPLIVSSRISNDGQYVAFKMKSEKAGASLTVQDKAAKWKKEIADVGNDYQFTEDSKWLIYRLPNDSIGLLKLGKSDFEYIGQVNLFEVSANAKGQWMACLLKDSQHDLLIIDLQRGTKIIYPGVREFRFNPNSDALLFQTIAPKGTAGKFYWLELMNSKKTCIGSGYRAFNMVFDKTGTKLAFLSNVQTNGLNIIALRYYELGMDSARCVLNRNTAGMDGMNVRGSLSVTFSKKGNKLFFGISPDDVPAQQISNLNEKVHLKNYRDGLLDAHDHSGSFLAVMILDGTGKVLRLQQNNDERFHLGGGANDDFIAVESNAYGNREEGNRRLSARPDIYLVSTKDGSRKLIKRHLICYDSRFSPTFSPTGKYMVWYDAALKQWFSYDVAGGITKNITDSIYTPLYADDDHPLLAAPEGIAGWMENDQSILIYDRYDLWKVDPAAKIPAINLTKGYGIKNKIRFRLVNFNSQSENRIKSGDTLLFAALNLHNKENGFFKLPLTSTGYLNRLTMQPRAYDVPFPPNAVLNLSGQAVPMEPQKAKNTDTYLLTCMSPTKYPNLYTTADFRHFKPITDFSPQKAYNWYTSELVHWNPFDGKKAEGVLYKPENFDPKKKYPVIFYYYEKSAIALNLFLNPELCRGDINIPWFVSNEYLVFVPDIYYKAGHPGESAYNSIVSAAQMLAKKPWVDAHKMGLQGHSFGGYETNYIVSHSHLFAAAASAAGLSDLVSGYSGDSQSFYESSQVRMGATLWQRPDLYIKNSPIFSADKVTTPIFMMHNKDDGNVPFTQGEELYSDLVRLGKKVWMVSYDGETHTIDEPANKLDFSIRLEQFFNYYLKDAPPPKWMTESSDSLELDYSGKKP
jgi:dipeptidyl aminopeptidase/acylaminoacyl peptidase